MAGIYHTNRRTSGTGTSRQQVQSDDMGGHGWTPGPEYFGPNGAGNRPLRVPARPVGGMADTVQPGGEPATGDGGSISTR